MRLHKDLSDTGGYKTITTFHPETNAIEGVERMPLLAYVCEHCKNMIWVYESDIENMSKRKKLKCPYCKR